MYMYAPPSEKPLGIAAYRESEVVEDLKQLTEYLLKEHKQKQVHVCALVCGDVMDVDIFVCVSRVCVCVRPPPSPDGTCGSRLGRPDCVPPHILVPWYVSASTHTHTHTHTCLLLLLTRSNINHVM